MPHEFQSIAEGYARKQYRISSEVRYQSYVSVLPYTKDLSYQKFCREIWPLSLDEKTEVEYFDPVPDKEVWEMLKKQLKPRKTEYEKILEKHK